MLLQTIVILIFLLSGMPCHFLCAQTLNGMFDTEKFECLLFFVICLFSHFSLLLGCALPIWMSSGYNDRPLTPFAGILSLGIGDTMVSLLVAM